MKSKLWAGLAAVAVLAAVAWFFAAPYLTFRAIAQAARAGDATGLERLVDFPSVRESLKVQLGGRLTAAIDKDRGLSRGPFGALGVLLGSSLVDQAVDAVVTPSGVAAMVRTGRAPLSDLSRRKTALPPPPEEVAPPPASAGGAAPRKHATRFGYAGLDAFKVVSPNADAPPLTWVLKRYGPFAWKLAAIELPPA